MYGHDCPFVESVQSILSIIYHSIVYYSVLFIDSGWGHRVMDRHHYLCPTLWTVCSTTHGSNNITIDII